MTESDLERVLDWVITSASSTINQRGKQLFNQKKVSLIKKEELFFKFKVIGRSAAYYDIVFIIEPNKKTINYECNCPYAEGGLLCKHVVAAAYLLKTNPSISKEVSAPKKRREKVLRQPVKLECPNDGGFDVKTILKPIQEKNRRAYDDEFTIDSIKLTSGLLEATIKSTYNSYFFDANFTIVKFVYKEGYYLVSCSDDSHKGICGHLEEVADYIAFQKNVNLLELIDENKFDSHAQKYFSKTGIKLRKGEKAKDLIYFKVTEGEMYVETIGRLEDLISPSNLGSFIDEALINRLTINKELSLIPKEKPSSETSLPALVWDLEPHNFRLTEVISIVGKSNKAGNKITSYIRHLESPFADDVQFLDNITSMFSAKEKLNGVLSEMSKNFVELWTALDSLLEESRGQIHYSRLGYGGGYNHRWEKDVPKKHELNPLAVHKDIRVKFKLYEQEDLYVFELYLELEDGTILTLPSDQVQLYEGCLLFVNEEKLLFLNSPKETMALQTFFPDFISKCTPTEFPEMMERVIKPVAKEFPIDFSQSGLDVKYEELTVKDKRIYISELNGFVILRPVVNCEGDYEVNLLDDNTEMMSSNDGVTVVQRDVEEEQIFLEELSSLHDSFHAKTQQSYFFLSYHDFTKNHWFLKAFEKLKKLKVSVFGLEKLKSLKFSPYTPTISMGMKSGQDWFETELDIAFGDNKVTVSQLKKAVINGGGYVELKDGSLGILPEEWLKKFSKIFRTADIQKENIRIAKTQFNIIEDLVEEDISPQVYAEIQEKKDRLSSFSGIQKVKQPKMLKAKLRDYQQEGLNWLGFLRGYDWGGILADDMGLGKTLQALGLITMEIEKKPKKTNLVIAPTTLLFNWKNEIEKFAPGIDYIIHHGERQNDAKVLKKHQLILTSYGVAVNDIELLTELKFNLIIIDESQAIKNLNSKRYKAVCKLKGDLRIAMSGTPIENNIYELYAQMNFVNPGFFMGLTAFKNDYANVIERNSNPDITNELRNKTRPFILRRTKEEVLTELPDKTEEYLYCEMGTAQRKVYDATRNEYRNYLLKKFEEEGVEKSQMYVLEGLTRLRQVCDSPLLIDKEGYNEKASAKLDELVKHVLEKTGNHKILIFSQFVKMLQLIKDKFDEHNIVYEYLDGKTTVKAREKCVDRFQRDDSCRAFLISLKAGGTGLNLTSADYVYIVDPWWNPATENQAIDRCYRMGQTKKVMAYRMICKDTVEEKIIELQNRKKALSDDVVGTGGMKSLDREDIEALFS